MTKTSYGWAIKGSQGFYSGWWLERFVAIAAHEERMGCSWEDCCKLGDELVRVKIVEVASLKATEKTEKKGVKGKLRGVTDLPKKKTVTP